MIFKLFQNLHGIGHPIFQNQCQHECAELAITPLCARLLGHPPGSGPKAGAMKDSENTQILETDSTGLGSVTCLICG